MFPQSSVFAWMSHRKKAFKGLFAKNRLSAVPCIQSTLARWKDMQESQCTLTRFGYCTTGKAIAGEACPNSSSDTSAGVSKLRSYGAYTCHRRGSANFTHIVELHRPLQFSLCWKNLENCRLHEMIGIIVYIHTYIYMHIYILNYIGILLTSAFQNIQLGCCHHRFIRHQREREGTITHERALQKTSRLSLIVFSWAS